MSGFAEFVSRFTARGAVLAGLVVLGSATGARAQSEAEIVRALMPLGPSRAISVFATSNSGEGDQSFMETLRNRTAFSASEREKIAAASADRPSIGLEIPFEYNSVKIGPKALPMVKSLGAALARPELRDSSFLIVGHTDAKGKDQVNLMLSERRAQAVKQYIVQNYGVADANLVAVGYGRTHLKDAANPLSSANRRVTAVNMSSAKSASR
ncbi:Peptidoglycan-associated lipoprotein [Methylobacterium crusticola]|uniref:Peptidoglycan-associated lipoprotein n=1 Tax=Methylobacterium crusticola TaxID=1697972 RepID=A0ABQ4QQK2_9HYPH|nr:OmpA family protein [Methylobacterium crusticola]GJD47304.1 Peptidoglycan-associated lipoprotein [Methylobacterium crusticola]